MPVGVRRGDPGAAREIAQQRVARVLLDLVLDPGTMQPLQAPRELLLQPFILCSAELFPNQRDAFLQLVVIFQRQSYQ
jgi:hypothetical protein